MKRERDYEEEDDEIYEAVWPDDGGKESDKQKQFKADMEKAGRRVEYYRGRFFYRGWSTRSEDFNELQEVIRDTFILLQWDDMGVSGKIIYPQGG